MSRLFAVALLVSMVVRGCTNSRPAPGTPPAVMGNKPRKAHPVLVITPMSPPANTMMFGNPAIFGQPLRYTGLTYCVIAPLDDPAGYETPLNCRTFLCLERSSITGR